jgi:hypothetical protein
MAKKGAPWTDAERERLVALKAAGMPHSAIAAELGRSVGAVTGELYSLRHPGRQEAIQSAYRERKGDGYKAMQAAHYRANRPRLVAEHREYYAANRGRVLERQAERRRDDAERVREIRRASNARNRAARSAGNNARAAVAKARAGDGRHLGTLTGLGADDALFWLPRLPAGCVARAIVDKLRQIAEVIRIDRDGDFNWRIQYAQRRDAWQAGAGEGD